MNGCRVDGAQVAQLEEQIDALESDAIRLRKALKNQAGMVGEEGFKYAGMPPELLVKVWYLFPIEHKFGASMLYFVIICCR